MERRLAPFAVHAVPPVGAGPDSADERQACQAEAGLGTARGSRIDLSHVRIHADAAAASSASARGAIAYTEGSHVAFGAGAFQPSTRAGQDLLAHELTHVLQQQAHPGRHVVQRQAGGGGAPGPAAGPSAEMLRQIARTLRDAMAGLGTDESAIFAALTGRTQAELADIRTAYHALTGRDLEADLRDELSRGELVRALRLLNQGVLLPEDEIYLAIEGLGTDEETIFRVLESLRGNAAGLRQLAADYERKYGDLIGDLRSDLSAEEYERARAILVPAVPDAQTDDCTPQHRNDVRAAHARAMELLRNAIAASGNAADPVVQAAARDHFGITLPATTSDDLKNWARVRFALSSMLVADRDAVYECEPSQSFFDGACLSGNIAVALANIHLCPLFWTTRTTVDQRAATFLHEWGHKFGRGVNRIFETYSWDRPAFTTAPAETRITWPDSYRCYILDVVPGTGARC
jgi:hypothetical protein